MSGLRAADLRVVAELDPAVWLANPAPGTEDAWAARALDAVAEDFGLMKGSPGHELMREVIDRFAHAEPVADLRLLRLRSPLEPMAVVLVHLIVDDGSEHQPSADDLLTFFDPDEQWYDAAPHVEVLDPAGGLRRAMMVSMRDGVLVMEDLDRLASVIRILDGSDVPR